jgi:hypothetical protein
MASMRSTSKVAFEPLSQTVSAACLGTTPRSASAVVAWASISNQIRNLVSGDQMATISGRL